MAVFRSLDEIVLAMLDFLRLVNPDMDTKIGTVARDLFVDVTANEVSKLYSELRNISNLQSLASASGTDLDRLARNYGLTRNTGTPASGTVIFTTNDLTSSIFIPSGTNVTATTGVTYRTLVDTAFDASKPNVYRANASRIRTDLDLAGITDQYALEIGVEANEFGSQGNAGKFSINRVSLPGISNVTNVISMTGGSSSESDAAFRSRALGVFAGANTGTALGYRNTVLADARVLDALTVEPGNPLMTRDGTQTGVNSEGDSIVISSGTGGKVDIYIQGTDSEAFAESTIYRDQSGKNDPTDSSNDFVLGQRDINPLLDLAQKRKLLLDLSQLPFQPVNRVVSVSGSLSGPNFVEKYVDENGSIKGNFELVKDESAYGGSPFGFDRIHWISKEIDLVDEQTSKGPFNGQDPLDFTDVSDISDARQDYVVTNENSTVDRTDRSLLTLHHTPVVTVQRVENLTTGERYSIVNQNYDGEAGAENTTGRIKISGSTLPTVNDVLQVNYIWNLQYDPEIDFDNLTSEDLTFSRTVQDSIDWGYANRVGAEQQDVLYSVADGYHIIVEHPISRVINANTWTSESAVNSAGKITVTDKILNLRSIVDADGRECFYTRSGNGSFSNKEITLPTDTVLAVGEYATVTYNVSDVYSVDGYDEGSFSNSTMHFQDGTVYLGQTVYADYIANVPTFLSTTPLTNLPASGDENTFVIGGTPVGDQPVSNEYDVGGEITRNLRFSPSYLKFVAAGISATGRLAISGKSWRKVDATFTVRRDSTDVDLKEAVKSALGISSIPSTMYVGMVDKLQRVTLTDGKISSIDADIDLRNHKIYNAEYSDGTAIENSSLDALTVSISQTDYNLENIPSTGQTFRVVCYVVTTNQTELITMSSAGTYISRYKYLWVERIAISSGFVGLSGNIDGTISIQSITQPTAGDTYYSSYSYTAPKEGERITINYDYNRLVGDATFLVEDIRPVTADVLVKAAGTVAIDVSVEVIPIQNYTESNSTLEQNVIETITNFLTNNGLNSTIDASDIINRIYTVNGIDRVEILKFNVSGQSGIKRSLTSGESKYFVAGVVEASVGER